MASQPTALTRPSHIARVTARIAETVLPADLLRDIRAAREWRTWVESLSSDLLSDTPKSPEAARDLFRRHVKLVEIETHARCNRVCSFCPNVVQDRRRDTHRTDASMLRRVFTQLGEIGYSRQVKVARYSEPLSDFEYLVEQLAVARGLMPKAELAIVTNTDYLTRPRLDALADAGVDRLYLSLYLRNGETWTPRIARTYIAHAFERVGLPCPRLTESDAGVEAVDSYYGRIRLFAVCRNFDTYGTDRGALMARYADAARHSPCREPFETFVIDYTGAVMPCCNLRSDMSQHQGMEVANLLEPNVSIFDVYVSGLAAWRRSMVGYSEKKYPCHTCQHRCAPERYRTAIERALRSRLARLDEESLA